MRRGAENAIFRDWLIFSKQETLNWRHVSYAFVVILGGLLVWWNRERRVFNLIACCLIPIVFLLVIATLPLQLFSGHGGVPYRAFAFTNYIVCGAVMLNLIGFSVAGYGGIPRRIAGVFFLAMAAVMMLQTSAIVHSFELTRNRDTHIVRGLEDFYSANDIPKDAPLAIALSRPADEPLVAYAGEHKIDALVSAMRMPWSYLPFTSLNSLIRPSPPTKQQSLDAWTECAKYGRDGFNVKYEYHPPVVLICY